LAFHNYRLIAAHDLKHDEATMNYSRGGWWQNKSINCCIIKNTEKGWINRFSNIGK